MNAGPGKRRGPTPDRVKIDEDWEESMKKALKRKRPEGGWPKSDKSHLEADSETDQKG